MDEKSYRGEIVWHIPENVKDEIEYMALYRYYVKVCHQDPKEVYERLRLKGIEKQSKKVEG